MHYIRLVVLGDSQVGKLAFGIFCKSLKSPLRCFRCQTSFFASLESGDKRKTSLSRALWPLARASYDSPSCDPLASSLDFEGGRFESVRKWM